MTETAQGIEPRVLTELEAAAYCRMSRETFRSVYPGAPIPLNVRRRLYDRRDLDNWLDTITGKSAPAGAAQSEQGAYADRQARKRRAGAS